MTAQGAIQLTSSSLCVRILPRGATLSEVRFGPDGANLVLGFDDPNDHQAIPIYAGALVGPVANRIAGGVVHLDGETHQMPRNEEGRTCLHSGSCGLHSLEWTVQDLSNSHVTLGIILADGAIGLPGQRKITAVYRLDGDVLSLTITAKSDRTTPMNIAPHPYWNLDGSDTIAQHLLGIDASHYLPLDAHNLPTGQIASLDGSALDYRQPKPISLTPELDVNFCLSRSARSAPTPSATLRGANGTVLAIATTAPGLQAYAGAFLPSLPGVLSDGRDLHPYAGIALEPQGWPNAPHHPNFPQITLHPGEFWQQITTYRLTPSA